MTVELTVANLRKTLNQHCHNYYILNSPTISDHEYDRLFKELQNLELQHPHLADQNSPTQRVGSSRPNSFAKIRHKYPMLSLDNAFTADEVAQWIKSNQLDGQTLFFEPKVDGLAISLTYKNGKLVQAVTRGDHEYGDDVTENARTVKSIPLEIPYLDEVEVRGEVYLPKSDFLAMNEKLRESGEETFSNSRNAAAGSLKQKDSRECAKRPLAFVAYSVVSDYPVKLVTGAVESQSQIHKFLKNNGFPSPIQESAPYCYCFPGSSPNDISTALSNFDVDRKQLNFDTDGCVIKVHSLELQQKLGNKTRSPRWAIAFKYPAEAKETKLLGITCQIGRRGTITPVAELEAVELAGAVVQRASLCNQDEVDRLGINIGDTVLVERSGEVIPKVTGLATKQVVGVWKMPENCPCCGSKLVRDGAHFFCLNSTGCKDQIWACLSHALGKGALDLDGCGIKFVTGLVEVSGCRKLSDVFAIQPESLSFAGPAAKIKFELEREKAKSAPLWRKICALGIEGIGQTSSKELCEKYSDILDMAGASSQDLIALLGPVAADNFVKYLAENADEIELLVQYGLSFSENKVTSVNPGSLAGRSFCITGTLVSGTRPSVSKLIEKHGGVIKGSVTKGLDFLVVGEGGGASKARSAEKLGTKCITEIELYQMIGIEMPIVSLEPESEF